MSSTAPLGSGSEAPALALLNINKRFGGVRAVSNVSLEIARGEIRGLLGENGAGKSTLMNIAYGLVRADSGSIYLHGQKVGIRSPQDAVRHGIGMVHQHFMLVKNMNAVENVALAPSRLPKPAGLREVRSRLEALITQFGLGIDLEVDVEHLSVGVRQRIEILKLLYRGADVLILDEPTATLTPAEWEDLSRFLKLVAEEGKAVIFITHKLDELFGVADQCTILRGGSVVETIPVSQTSKSELASKMVGREVLLSAPRLRCAPGDIALAVKDLTVKDDGRNVVEGVSFEVRSGEAMGIAGVAGNGQSHLVAALLGLARLEQGEVEMLGERLTGHSPRDFASCGGAIIPEDRQTDGLALSLTLLDNLAIKSFRDPEFVGRVQLDWKTLKARLAPLVTLYDVKAEGLQTRAEQLSGGNQQKLVLARELGRMPRLVLAYQPVYGLDVAAMEAVYARLNEAKAAGAAILLFSYDLDEILSFTDRFAVIANGRLSAAMDSENPEMDRIGLLMAGEA